MYKYIKRLLDIILSIFFLIILFIPMLIIAILIIIETKESFVFKQIRTGIYGKKFLLYKFRSMNKNRKYTKIGKFIKKYSLDELLQIINIIKGNMSFIGPRPWIPEYYKLMNNNQKKKYNVKPGITGFAQVNGRNKISISDKIGFDIFYVDNFSFWLDVKIFFLTIKTVFTNHDSIDSDSIIKQELNYLKKINKKI